MPYVIGTAGHIDHGKTSLVKALTGQDTDRLKEEKERGISIDLGFAYLDLPDGSRAGVVDVPGHERFIRNMLAGAHGIDLVLFTVAADDGVMPQTEEHLDIIHLLGIRKAIFVITKTDLVSDVRIGEVEEEIAILTSATALEGSPVVPFSFLTGRGLDGLREHISRMLLSDEKRQGERYFRLPVDRVFLLQGHGLVVTGTALSGQIRVGDRVRCLPGNQSFRVRSVQVHNEAVEVAERGQRVALNLSGHEKPSIERGHVICHEKITMISDRFDAFLEVRPTAAAGIKNHQRLRVHLGTAERLARVILLTSQEKIGPKQSAYCQISVSAPLLVVREDRFIVRDETAQRTLGGGVVIHPWARKHKKAERGLHGTLKSLHQGSFGVVVEVLLDESESFALPIGPLHQFANLRDDETQKRLEQLTTIRAFDLDGEKLYTTDAKWRRLKERVSQALQEFHSAHPLAAGMDMEEMREKLPGQIAPRLFRAVVERFEAERTIARDASLLRLPGHTIQLRDDETTVVEKVKALLRGNPLAPPDMKQMESEIGISRAKLGDLLRVMEREGSIVRVTPELCFSIDAIERVKATLRQHLSENSEVTPATFRDLFGTTRKYAIPLLQYLDDEGITVRVGDTRRLKRGAA